MSKRQETPIKKNAFVHKLYSMLNDPELSNLIWWTRDEDSNTFALSPGKDFAKALTRYFKHGNVASFVRQLHMYGFHKVSDPSHANVTSTSTDADLPVWEFKHSSGKFKKNDESSLVYIKRRSSSNNSRNVYNNETDANVVIPTSTPSPEHAQYLQEGSHPYLPQGYYFYNGHQVTHHMSPHVQYPSGGVPAPLHQSKHPQMYYTQKPMPSSIPHAYSHENVLEKPKMPDIQRSISPQSQPSSQHHVSQIPKPHPVSHIPQPPISQAQLQPPLQDATKPPHPQADAQDSQQPQHYTPNLQFRKIWENDNLHSRPRNPSLLFDPLAPVPVTSQLQPLHQLQNTEQPQSSFSYLLSRSDSRSSYASARESITSTRDSFVSNRDSIASGRDSLASAKDSISGTKDSFSSARDSFGNSRDSFTLLKDPDNRSSIKLPPPSSIHNPSFYSNTSNTPFSMVSDTNSHASTVTSSNLPKAPSNESPSSSTSTIKVKSNSIPETSTTAKRPSIFPSHSVHEKLRPSLIELHFGSSSKASILNPQHDSIGSQSSHNSIFSNNSSLSSTSSFHRTSSFGSISHHPIFANKNSISIAPHEVLPITLLTRSRTEQEVNSDSKDSTPPSKTPKVLQMNSPIKRSSTTAIPTTNGVPIALKIRSLNSSPLSRLLTNEDLIAVDNSNPKSSITKVSIHSLLDDDQAEGKILLPSKNNIKAGLREVKEVITELNEEKEANEETDMKDIQPHSNGNDEPQNHDDNQHSTSLADPKRQKLD